MTSNITDGYQSINELNLKLNLYHQRDPGLYSIRCMELSVYLLYNDHVCKNNIRCEKASLLSGLYIKECLCS